jgi:hypothetical protein
LSCYLQSIVVEISQLFPQYICFFQVILDAGLLQVHGDYSEETGAKIERPVGDDAETDAEPVEVPGA